MTDPRRAYTIVEEGGVVMERHHGQEPRRIPTDDLPVLITDKKGGLFSRAKSRMGIGRRDKAEPGTLKINRKKDANDTGKSYPSTNSKPGKSQGEAAGRVSTSGHQTQAQQKSSEGRRKQLSSLLTRFTGGRQSRSSQRPQTPTQSRWD